MMLITVLPALLLFLTIIVFPILWTIYAGFFDIPLFGTEWTWVGISNYSTLIADPDVFPSIFRSTVFAASAVALQLVAGTGLALLFNRTFKFEYLARALVLLPYLIPSAVLGFMAVWMGNSTWGILNIIPLQWGLIDAPIPWFGSLDFAMLAVILTTSWKWMIFVMLMVLARLQSIPEGFYEAAYVAGASRYQIFRDITLPHLRGIIFIVLLLRGIFMFNKFDIIWVLTGGGPGDATTTAPILAYDIAFNEGSLGEAAAFSTLLFGILLVGGVFYVTYFDPEEEVRVE